MCPLVIGILKVYSALEAKLLIESLLSVIILPSLSYKSITIKKLLIGEFDLFFTVMQA